MHEAVLEDVFRDDRCSFCLGSQSHVLRLAIGGEAWVLFGAHIGGGERIVAHHADGFSIDLQLDSDLAQLAENRLQMSWFAAGDVEIASGHGAGDDEGASLNSIWDDAVLGTIQLGDTLHADGGGTGALDASPHFVEQISEVGDFRLARAVAENRLTFG